MYTSLGIAGASMSLTLTSSHDTTAQNSMWVAVSVNGKGKPPSFGSRMYLFNLRASNGVARRAGSSAVTNEVAHLMDRKAP
jgi:hypothetical protein